MNRSERLIRFSLRHRLLVVTGALLLLAVGGCLLYTSDAADDSVLV